MQNNSPSGYCFPNPRLLFSFTICSVSVFLAMVAFAGITLPRSSNADLLNRTLTFEQRVDYQRKIEEVYWRHRIWPKERTDSKPTLETVMSRRQIENKVRDHLRNTRVLEDYWQQPISSQQLQAEMEGMAQHTKDPEMLRELFETLGNDPFIIAECLARPALSERLVKEFYETNPKPGGEAKPGGQARRHSQSAPAESGTAGNPRVFTGYSLPALNDTATTCTDNTWSSLVDLPARRANHTAVWTGSEMIVWGGVNYDLPVDTGDRYNPATDSWSQVSLTNAPLARYDHTAVWTGTDVIIWGGYRPGDIILNSGGKYNPANDTWTPTSISNAPTARYFHTAIWTGTAMIVWGGIDPTSFANTGGRYDPITDSWTTMNSANAPPGRIQHSATWIGTEMVVWGGRIGAMGYLNSGAKYNPVSDTWTVTNTVNTPAARFGHSAVWTGSEVIIWGGWNGNALSDGARYNPSANTWIALSANNPPQARYSHSAIWTASEMIVWGGNAFPGQGNSGSRYNPATNIWSPMSMTNAPSSRDTHTAIWTGDKMIVWGGGYGETLNTGGQYDPTANTWTSVRTTNTPDGRYEHRAVWTGSEMIVWGGELNFPSATKSGGRYDPALDTWMPTSTVNAPEGREAYTAVWTGTEMIVWGGWYPQGYGGFLNSGGRYNPGTDNWTPTTLINAPEERRWHSAVWTGSEMIVWGGEVVGGSGPSNTGGRYNPSTDSWIATSTTGAPGPKIDHTAVWTGSEMIVWGGGPYTATNTGARYNPVSDSWTATNTIGTPPRAGQSAVWTGNEMIVWGGYDGSVHVNTGARYNPNTDVWTATSLYNAPDGRIAHSAIWTGEEMIVWGGYSYQQDRFFNTGGRYRPSTDSWAATATINAPNEAEFPIAVWTGSRMIVWGGYFVFYDPFGQSHGYVLSTGGEYCPGSGPPPGKFANISTRAFVQTGDNVMIGGLIVTGSGQQRVILRAIGPSLSNAGITDALQDPVLELHDSTGALLASNDNWPDASNHQAIIESGLAPSHNLESAILTSLNPGAYTAVLRGVNNGTGTAVVEAYGLDQTAGSKLGNISTRAFAQTGDRVMIGGLIVTGSGSESVVARAIGPSLTQSGVANALADPVLELHDRNGALVASNDNWMDAPNKQAIIESGLAPSHSLESAILTSLNPGPYTAIVRGVQNGVGVAVVEVFGLN
jgi:N-acetylneuraminic acid mutarotase